jgi:Restriction endonuclease
MEASRNKQATEYEKIAAGIYRMLSPSSHVQHDVKLLGKDSGTERQVDILIEDTVAGHKIAVAVDCKNWNSRIAVPDVGSFASFVKDIGMQKGVMLSKKGYSKNALRYAKQLGIDLCQLHDAASRNWKLDLRVPIVVEELGITVGATFRAVLDRPTTLPDIMDASISGTTIKKLFLDKQGQGNLNLSLGHHELEHDLNPALLYMTADWTIKLEKLQIVYTVFSSSLRFGYVDQFPSSKAIVNLSDNIVNMFCDIKDIVSYKESFTAIRSLDDLAIRIEAYFKCTLAPTFEGIKTGQVVAKRIG